MPSTAFYAADFKVFDEPGFRARMSGIRERLRPKLEAIGPGVWEHIDHASTDDPEMRAIGHPGYEWVAADRSANVAAWTSPKVREVIERRGIKLTSYRDLGKR